MACDEDDLSEEFTAIRAKLCDNITEIVENLSERFNGPDKEENGPEVAFVLVAMTRPIGEDKNCAVSIVSNTTTGMMRELMGEYLEKFGMDGPTDHHTVQ